MAIFSTKEDDGTPDHKARHPVRDGVLSIIAADLKVVGGLTTDGVVKIDGLVEGNIRAERQVLVSKGGEVRGDISSKEVIVGGRIQGNVCASGRVEVQSSAIVNGDILTKRILVHEGGEVNGHLRMKDSDVANAGLQPTPGGEQHSTVAGASGTTGS
jgi:cytoskeletal protein CcmA (bactofilin family)